MERQRHQGAGMKDEHDFTTPLSACNERLAVSAEQAAKMLSIGKTHFYAMLNSGKIGPMARKLGRRSLFSVQELRDWVNAGMPVRQRWIEQKKLNNSNIST